VKYNRDTNKNHNSQSRSNCLVLLDLPSFRKFLIYILHLICLQFELPTFTIDYIQETMCIVISESLKG